MCVCGRRWVLSVAIIVAYFTYIVTAEINIMSMYLFIYIL